jgi:hypothetical protein
VAALAWEIKMDKDLADRLQAEYLYIQKVIEDFDGRVITIKAWSVSFSLVAFLGAFAVHSDGALLVASASATLFWFLEAYWKRFQFVYYRRCNDIEKYFRGEITDLCPHQIGAAWDADWKNRRFSAVFGIMLWANVLIPHAIVAIAGVVLYWLSRAGHIAV